MTDDPRLTRLRTAELLKRLRAATKELRMLQAKIRSAYDQEAKPHLRPPRHKP